MYISPTRKFLSLILELIEIASPEGKDFSAFYYLFCPDRPN